MNEKLNFVDDVDGPIEAFWIYSIDFDIGEDDSTMFFTDKNKIVRHAVEVDVIDLTADETTTEREQAETSDDKCESLKPKMKDETTTERDVCMYFID